MICDILREWLDTDATKSKSYHTSKVKQDPVHAPAKPEEDTPHLVHPEEYLLASGLSEDAMKELKKLARSANL